MSLSLILNLVTNYFNMDAFYILQKRLVLLIKSGQYLKREVKVMATTMSGGLKQEVVQDIRVRLKKRSTLKVLYG